MLHEPTRISFVFNNMRYRYTKLSSYYCRFFQHISIYHPGLFEYFSAAFVSIDFHVIRPLQYFDIFRPNNATFFSSYIDFIFAHMDAHRLHCFKSTKQYVWVSVIRVYQIFGWFRCWAARWRPLHRASFDNYVVHLIASVFSRYSSREAGLFSCIFNFSSFCWSDCGLLSERNSLLSSSQND